MVLPQPAGPVIMIFLPRIADLTKNFHLVPCMKSDDGLSDSDVAINSISSNCSVGSSTPTGALLIFRLSSCSHVDPLYQLGPSMKYLRSTVPIVRIPSLSIIFTARSPSLKARATRSLDMLSFGQLYSVP